MAPPTGLIRPNGQPITQREVSRARAEGLGRPNEGASHRGTFLSSWRPGLRSADADWLNDRDDVVARARDLVRNDPVASSAVSRKVNSTVGFQWRLSSRVNARALGIGFEAARELSAHLQALFKPFAYGPSFMCDAERTKNLPQLMRVAAAHMPQDGEALATVEWASDEPTQFKTRLRMIDPDRLSNPNGAPDTPTLRRGVERSTYGAVQAYWIREGHPGDLGFNAASMVWKRWPRFATPLGRPQVLHAFDAQRASQSRGISKFVAALKAFRALSKFTDATLEAATINALLVAFVKSNAGVDAIKETFEAEDLDKFAEKRAEFFESNPVNLFGARIPVLPMGDEIEMQNQSRDTGGFDAFTRSILRLIAAALGITYEELAMDFSQTNYSSARAALVIAWQETVAMQGLLAAQISTPFYVAWLEEAYDLGLWSPPKGAPDFYDAIDAYADCVWIGPPRGYIDETKEVDAAAARVESQQSTLEKECGRQGDDWEEILEQLAREKKKREELGIPTMDTGLRIASPDIEPGAAADTAEGDRQRDERPASARARIAKLARSSEHAASLDARPNA